MDNKPEHEDGKHHGEHHRHEHHEYEINVNSRQKIVKKNKLSYDEVVELAHHKLAENVVYTVTYKHGPKENPHGSMSKGDVVEIKNGMDFDVDPTTRS